MHLSSACPYLPVRLGTAPSAYSIRIDLNLARFRALLASHLTYLLYVVSQVEYDGM